MRHCHYSANISPRGVVSLTCILEEQTVFKRAAHDGDLTAKLTVPCVGGSEEFQYVFVDLPYADGSSCRAPTGAHPPRLYC